MNTNVVDILFTLRGDRIPLDHGYSLMGAIAPYAPVHGPSGWAVHPIAGDQVAPGVMALRGGQSKLTLRAPASELRAARGLVGRTLSLDGYRVTVGCADVHALRPAPRLVARLVTIRGYMDPEPFVHAVETAVRRYAQGARVDVGDRRIVRIHGCRVVGYEVVIGGLTPSESLAIQAHGVGGRRHMGCGVFIPTGAT